MADIFCSNQDALRQISVSGLTNLTEAYVGTLRAKFVWVNNESGIDDNITVIIPNSNPPSGRWISPQSPIIPSQVIPWTNIDKTGSSVNDLTTKSITDLTTGTIRPSLLPEGIPYFATPPPSLILSTNRFGQYQLSTISADQVHGLIPFSQIDWTGIAPSYVGAESTLYFDPTQFNRDAFNNISIKIMSASQAGLAIPGTGISTDDSGNINVIYGTGENQALEGNTPMLGDVSGVHGGNIVDGLRGIPLTFFFNELVGKNGYVLTLNVDNQSTPYFYLAPGGSGGTESGLPDPTGDGGDFLYTDGTSWYPKKITLADVGLPPSIESFSTSVTLAEVGQSFINPNFTATYSEAPTSASLKDNLFNISASLSNVNSFNSTHTFTLNSPGNVIFTLTANYSTPLTASISITWGERLFYGHQTSFTSVSSLQSNNLTTSPQGSYTVDAALGEYIYFAIPSDFATPTFSVNGFYGGFSLVTTATNTNTFGITTNYNIYRSDYPSLGNTTVQLLLIN
jgi:hypothetical protein